MAVLDVLDTIRNKSQEYRCEAWSIDCPSSSIDIDSMDNELLESKNDRDESEDRLVGHKDDREIDTVGCERIDKHGRIGI